MHVCYDLQADPLSLDTRIVSPSFAATTSLAKSLKSTDFTKNVNKSTVMLPSGKRPAKFLTSCHCLLSSMAKSFVCMVG